MWRRRRRGLQLVIRVVAEAVRGERREVLVLMGAMMVIELRVGFDDRFGSSYFKLSFGYLYYRSREFTFLTSEKVLHV